ncbi:Pyridoxal phosphate phosphatase YbhA [Clostridiales bacterium CHKCI006]|nr:Pyridoxal phosphate phosphatase YbhA [Clostridiales bacterium CHKCI006]
MKPKYFFFDVDGTLTNMRTGVMVPSAIDCLHRLMAAGHFVALNTGRAHYKAEKVRQELGMQHMICNGGNDLVIHGKLVQNIPLPKAQCIQLLDQLTELKIGFLIALDDSEAVYASNDLFLQQVGKRQEPTVYHLEPSFDYHQVASFYKIYYASTTFDLRAFPDLKGFLFQKTYTMIQPDHKKQGLMQMMNILNAPLEDVVVFGDDDNDLDVFDPALWTCVAMGNACDALKAQSTYITDANVDDGILNFCLRMHYI